MFLKMISTRGEQGEIHIRKCSSEVGSRNAKTSARDESHFQNRMMVRDTRSLKTGKKHFSPELLLRQVCQLTKMKLYLLTLDFSSICKTMIFLKCLNK